jgi:hypothetical protein
MFRFMITFESWECPPPMGCIPKMIGWTWLPFHLRPLILRMPPTFGHYLKLFVLEKIWYYNIITNVFLYSNLSIYLINLLKELKSHILGFILTFKFPPNCGMLVVNCFGFVVEILSLMSLGSFLEK